MKELLDALTKEAREQLWDIPRVPWIVRGKRFVRKYILGQLTEPADDIPWPKGCLLEGLVQAGMTDEVKAYFDLWIKKGAKLYTIDDLLAGQALLQTADERRYEMKAHAMMGFLYAHAKDEQGSLPYRPLHGTGHIYADGIGMVCPFAVGYGVKYRDGEAVKLAMRQFRNFMENGMDKLTGLPYHAYKYHAGAYSEQLGAVGWGRAAGWILYGLGMSLLCLEQEPEMFPAEREEILSMTKQLAGTVLKYRNEEGLFGAFLCRADSPTDTSATAMILHGIRVLPDEMYRTACEQIWGSLQKYCDAGKVLQAQSECIGLSEYGNRYGSFPWSVGMTLSLAAQLYFHGIMI